MDSVGHMAKNQDAVSTNARLLYGKQKLPDQGTNYLLEKGVRDKTKVVERFDAILECRIRSAPSMYRIM